MKRGFKILIIGFVAAIFWLAIPMDWSLNQRPLSYILLSQEGQLLASRIAEDEQWRFPEMDSVPHRMKACIVQFEDKRFTSHFGVDFKALLRALYLNTKQGEIVSGGSTLTMQLMRLNQNNSKRNYWNKLREVLASIKVELKMDKEEILKKYLSHAPFGGNIVGAETASWRYFLKPLDKLSWAEASTIAVLPNAPGLIHISRNRESLLKKRNQLLHSLFEDEIITEVELQLAMLEPLPDIPKALPQLAPHLLNQSIKENPDRFRILSSLNYEYQTVLNGLLKDHWLELKQNDIQNASIIVIDNKTRRIVSYNANVIESPKGAHNDMIKAKRSSGSILKPLLYALAVNNGTIMPNEICYDIPISIQGFSPKNYNKNYSGLSDYKSVIARSLNIPSVELLQKYGISRFISDLQALNITSIDKDESYYGLSLILGGAEVSLYELVDAYSHMANVVSDYSMSYSRYLAQKNELTYLNDEMKVDSVWLWDSQLVSASSAWEMLDAMRRVERPDEYGSWQMYNSARSIHWKTGTSYGHRDAWAVGVTPEFTVGVWVGNSSGLGKSPIVGVKAAGPILFDVYNYLPRTSEFEIPYDDMRPSNICKQSGLIAGDNCYESAKVFMPKVNGTKGNCHYHKRIHLDAQGSRVKRDCAQSTVTDTSWFVISPVASKFYKKYNPSYQELPQWSQSCQSIESNDHLNFVYPVEDAIVYLPQNLKGEKEKCVFKAEHRFEDSKVFWHLNEKLVSTTSDYHSLEVNLSAGDYRLTIQDEFGHKISRNISVLSR